MTEMFRHPVIETLAVARQISNSSVSIEVTRPARALTDDVWEPPTQHAVTETACHRSEVGTLAFVAQMTWEVSDVAFLHSSDKVSRWFPMVLSSDLSHSMCLFHKSQTRRPGVHSS